MKRRTMHILVSLLLACAMGLSAMAVSMGDSKPSSVETMSMAVGETQSVANAQDYYDEQSKEIVAFDSTTKAVRALKPGTAYLVCRKDQDENADSSSCSSSLLLLGCVFFVSSVFGGCGSASAQSLPETTILIIEVFETDSPQLGNMKIYEKETARQMPRISEEQTYYAGGTWTSADETVATVSSSGFVTPIAPGTSEIQYRTADGSETLKAAVEVLKVELRASPERLDLQKGESVSSIKALFPAYHFSPKTVSWSMKDTTVAGFEIPGSGLPTATGKESGSTTLTAKHAESGREVDIPVTVRESDDASAADSLTITPDELPGGVKGEQYFQSIEVEGGREPYTSEITGELPPGLTYDPEALTISGTPTAHGAYPFKLLIVDDDDLKAEKSYEIKVKSNLKITTQSLPMGYVKYRYEAAIETAGGGDKIEFALKSDDPNASWLTMDSKTGLIQGEPQAAGSFPVTVTASDETGAKDEKRFTVKVAKSPGRHYLWINTEGPFEAQLGQPFEAGIQVIGSHKPFRYDCEGELPDGVQGRFNKNVFTVSGTPKSAGEFRFTVRVTDGVRKEVSREYVLTVTDPDASPKSLKITPEGPFEGTVNVSFTQTFSAEGGVEPYAFALQGDIPTGLTFDENQAKLAGTPMVAGEYRFEIKVTDAREEVASCQYTLTVNEPSTPPEPLKITTEGPFEGTVNESFAQTFSAEGGVEPYAFALQGDIPTGLTFDENQAKLAGTPTVAGEYRFEIKVTDARKEETSRQYTLSVNEPSAPPKSLMITTDSLAKGTRNTAYTQTFAAEGGVKPYAFELKGDMPDGLKFDAESVRLVGTPIEKGEFQIELSVTDGEAKKVSKAYTLTIENDLMITVSSDLFFPKSSYGVTLTARGGKAPYTFKFDGDQPENFTIEEGSLRFDGNNFEYIDVDMDLIATDAEGETARKHVTVKWSQGIIAEGPTVGVEGEDYFWPAEVVNQEEGVSFTMGLEGDLPDGLNFSEGVLSGKPNTGTAGIYELRIIAQGSNGTTLEKTVWLVIETQKGELSPQAILDPHTQGDGRVEAIWQPLPSGSE